MNTKRFSSTVISLVVLLAAAVWLVSSCSRVVHKEYEIIEGESCLRSETEYDRIGDQTLSGLEAMKNTPDGTQLTVKVEQQKSEGKLQIESAIAALADLYVKAASGGVVTAGEIEAIKNTLTGVIASQ